MPLASPCLDVQLGRLKLPNPILVASGTFGYAREMEHFCDLSRLGGIIPKTITLAPRPGNPPPRTHETAAGLLNSIGLDNDGLDLFIANLLPYFRTLSAPIIVSIAGKTIDEFARMAERLEAEEGIAALELNISCPNVSGGVDFGTSASACEEVLHKVRRLCHFPLLAKLTPNVTNLPDIARGAEAGGADALTLINTCLGMAIDWRRRKPILGNVVGGLSGPAIKPIALRCVFQVSQAVKIPICGAGGIASIDDVMEFFIAGASAVQIGTANFYNPTLTMHLLDSLPATLQSAGISSISEIVGTLQLPLPK